MPHRFPQARLLIFAKAPQPGRVKTRLIPAIGAQAAAKLHQRLASDTLQRMSAADLCPLELWVSPDAEQPFFRDMQRRHGMSLHVQQGANLGERMYNAAADALTRADSVALIGTDCPPLSGDHLADALAGLQRHDAMLGPAEDGGYVLLALKRAEWRLFDAVPWGTGEVADITRRRLRQLDWQWRELPLLWDLDRPQDLSRWDGAAPSVNRAAIRCR